MLKLKSKLILNSCILLIFFINNQCSITKPFGSKFKEVDNINDAYYHAINNNVTSKIGIKFSAKVTENTKINNLSGNINIFNDSNIVFNIVSRSLGIELLRVKCTPDSLFFIDKLNKKYYSGDYSYISKYLNFDVSFYLLKSFLIGKVYGFDKYNETNFNNFDTTINKENQYLFNYNYNKLNNAELKNKTIPNFKHSFILNKYGLLSNNCYELNKNNFSLNINYNYVNTSFPDNYNIDIINGLKELNIIIDYITVNKELYKINLKVPGNYTLLK